MCSTLLQPTRQESSVVHPILTIFLTAVGGLATFIGIAHLNAVLHPAGFVGGSMGIR